MKIKSTVLLLAMLVSGAAFAADASCGAKAAEKKLAGAAKTSFMKKCETDAMSSCEAMSKEKKLAGAAKSSFEKKCKADQKG